VWIPWPIGNVNLAFHVCIVVDFEVAGGCFEAMKTGGAVIGDLLVNPSFLRKAWNPHKTWGVAAKALQNRVGIEN
jgi:hypothetical protein